MLNAVFVVWRECFEIVLIIGILYSYLRRQDNFRRSFKFLALGIFAGMILSGILAYAIQHVETELQGNALSYFETGMLTVAALLMTHMCIWMKQHSRTIKKELEQGLLQALSTKHLIGVTLLAMIALAREGTEVVVFFYGMGIEAKAGGTQTILLSALIGMGLTALTALAFYRGMRIFKPKWFFRVTTVFLLITASSLLLMATRKLIQAEVLPTLSEQLWDTSFLLDERSSVGQVISSITGYQSTPSGMLVLVGSLYWLVTLSLYFKWTPLFEIKHPTGTRINVI